MTSPQMLVQGVSSLFSLPEVAFRVNALIDDPRAGCEDFAEAILSDTGITARLLKLVNSASYGFSSRVETVSRAVTLIGTQELRNLVLATSIVSVFQGIPPDIVDMETFWLNSFTCGIVARSLGRHCRVLHSERMFVAGLLHGVGRLIFYSQCADQYRLVLEHRDQDEEAIAAAERRVFGFDYAALGGELLKEWKLPCSLQTAVAYHLDPEKAPDYHLETCIIHVATRVTRQLSPSINFVPTTEEKQPQIDEYARNTLQLDDERLHDITQEAGLRALEMLHLVDPKAMTLS